MWGEIDTSNDARVREVRRCGKCTQPQVTVYHVTQHYSRGMPTGRSYAHRCGACRTTFDSISTWRAATQYMFAGICAFAGFAMFSVLIGAIIDWGPAVLTNMDGRSWGTVLFGLALFLGGMAWAAWTTWLVARLMFLNPVAGSR
jgi:hypothetical protein